MQKPMNFLIVDDNLELSHCLKNYLLDKGYNCSCLADPPEVFEWLDSNQCDAVIMDVKMPQIDGISLTRQVREKHPALPILMSTGLGYKEELLQAALAAGANGYVSKVMGPKSLLIALLRIVNPTPVSVGTKAA